MLAEKFFLILEVLICGQSYSNDSYPDGSPKVISVSHHVSVTLPSRRN
jgi:hypothetical protein